MKAFRFLLAGLILCVVGLRADTVPGEFFINLNTLNPLSPSPTGGCNPLTTPEGSSCVNEWGTRDFTVFQNSESVPNADSFFSVFAVSGVFCGASFGCIDPDMDIDLGGFSPPVTTNPFTFNSPADCPNGICDFINQTGQTWTSLLFTTAFDSTIQNMNFRCDGTTVFQFCGFAVSNGNLEIAFLQGTGSGIVSAAVPEPASWAFFPIGLGALALIAGRWKSARQRA